MLGLWNNYGGEKVSVRVCDHCVADVGRCTDLGRPGIDFIDFKQKNGTRWYPPSAHPVGPVFSPEMCRAWSQLHLVSVFLENDLWKVKW
jgi:hypothetical protein